MWTYSQSTGTLTDGLSRVQGIGYAGNGQGLNNPAMQEAHDVGPLPQGLYTPGPPTDQPDGVGEYAIPLAPDSANQMFGRSGFFMHGDNPAMDHTASDGCIVMARPIREKFAASGEQLLVTP